MSTLRKNHTAENGRAAPPLPSSGGVGGGVCNILADRILLTPPPAPPLHGRGAAAHRFSSLFRRSGIFGVDSFISYCHAGKRDLLLLGSVIYYCHAGKRDLLLLGSVIYYCHAGKRDLLCPSGTGFGVPRRTPGRMVHRAVQATDRTTLPCSYAIPEGS